MNYRPGDFVRILSPDYSNITRFQDGGINIFKILAIDQGNVSLENYSVPLSMTGIEPIPIDRKSDLQIYYDPILAASFVDEGEDTPVYCRDYGYYFDRFKNCIYEDKTYQELILEKNIRFVHEVQHYLYDEFQDNGLKIRLY